MANVHEVDIKGMLAFDANGDAGVLRLLGWLSLPTIGFKIEFSVTPVMVPNEMGGETAMYRYEIFGSEAVGAGAIRQDVEILERGGMVDIASYRDKENGSAWVHLKLQRKLTLRTLPPATPLKKWIVNYTRIPTNYNDQQSKIVEAETKEDARELVRRYLGDYSSLGNYVYAVREYDLPEVKGQVL